MRYGLSVCTLGDTPSPAMRSMGLGGSSAGPVARVVGSGVSWCLVRHMTVLLLAGATERPSTGILSVGWSPTGRCRRIARQVLECDARHVRTA